MDSIKMKTLKMIHNEYYEKICRNEIVNKFDLLSFLLSEFRSLLAELPGEEEEQREGAVGYDLDWVAGRNKLREIFRQRIREICGEEE